MNTGFNCCMNYRNLFLIVVIGFSCALASGCGPSEKQLKEQAERKEKDAEIAKIQVLLSRISESFKDPASAQFRSTKLILGGNALCGEVNSKNSYGGYVGFKPFAVNSSGKTIIFEAIPLAVIIALSNKTMEERQQYMKKYSLQFAMLGEMSRAVQMKLEFNKMEGFNMDNFSHWGDCFSKETLIN